MKKRKTNRPNNKSLVPVQLILLAAPHNDR